MLRQLCFATIALLFSISNCSASFVIDSFATASTIATTSTNFAFTPLGFQASLDPGEMATITYDFASVGGTLSNFAAMTPGSGPTLATLGFSFNTFPFAPGIDLDISGSSFTTVSTSLTSSPTSVQIGPGLASTTDLTFKFTNNTGAESGFTFGGGPLTAVPEPTSLLMFTSAMGLVLVPRRRRR